MNGGGELSGHERRVLEALERELAGDPDAVAVAGVFPTAGLSALVSSFVLLAVDGWC